VQLTFNRRNCD